MSPSATGPRYPTARQTAPPDCRVTQIPHSSLLADTGYFSDVNVKACLAMGVDPLIAIDWQPHYPPLADRGSCGSVGKEL